MSEYKIMLRKIIQDTLMSKEITLPFVPTKGQTVATGLELVRADTVVFDVEGGIFVVTEEPDIYASLGRWSSSQARVDYNAKLVQEHRGANWVGGYNQFSGEQVPIKKSVLEAEEAYEGVKSEGQ